MFPSLRTPLAGAVVIALASAAGLVAAGQGGTPQAGRGQALPPAVEVPPTNAMTNPYRMLENWPHLGDIKPGAAIGLVPDGKGVVWMHHRSVPGTVHVDSAGTIVKRFDVTSSTPQRLLQNLVGNFWAMDSRQFGDAPDAGVK